MNKTREINPFASAAAGTDIHVRVILICPKTMSEKYHQKSKDNVTMNYRMLRRMGIIPRSGETPKMAWQRTICEENGIEFNGKLPEELGRIINNNPDFLRFQHYLS
jgi:hypothetical protein